tara:strand:- start:16 stop:183 length:168 start_codon:yes stop_codon:yes gene_type:complete
MGFEDPYSIPSSMAVLWVLYPIGSLVLIELILRAIDDDDDDQGGGVMSPVYQPIR